MKKYKPLLLPLLLSLFVVFAYAAYLFFMNGTVFDVKGDVAVKKAGMNNWLPVKGRYKLNNGDTIRTGQDSEFKMVIGNTANMVVGAQPGSELRIASKDKETLELIDGTLIASLTRPVKVRKFLLKTPVCVCAVRGTGWSVSARPLKSEIDVFEGRVKAGTDVPMCENDPYTVCNGQKLIVEKNPDSSFNYGLLEDNKYLFWNKWIKISSGKLLRMGVLNLMAGNSPHPYPSWQEGITYASWRAAGYQQFDSELSIRKMEKETNASWLNIIATWYQKTIHSTEIFSIPTKTPTDESLDRVLSRAQRMGMHTMLTPLIDPSDGKGGAWRAEITFSTDEEWNAWFESYKTLLLHYAKLAERNNVDILNIGTELTETAIKRPDKWKELISGIRTIYHGRLVYTANWFEEYKEITFWKDLDYAGISAYFPVAGRDNPFYFEIRKRWNAWARDIEAWQKTHGKPVIFTEIGYRSVTGAARQPWDYVKGGGVDLRQQYNCYKAVFSTFWNKKWFYGMYWWVWDTKTGIYGKFDTSYTPDDKPALKLMNKWYYKPDPHRYKSIRAILWNKLSGLFAR